MSHTTYRILSCDGGGIRGVITAKLLQALDPSVIKNIDLFAGTSTGSIIALGLASGVPIDTIVELYSSQIACSKIFQPYLPLARQDRLGRAFAAGEQALIATSEVPADSDLGDRLRELGPVLLFPAMDCGNCWPPIFLTLRSPMSGRSGTKALLLRASN